jgi:glucose uptake protein
LRTRHSPYREGHVSVHFVAASCGGLAISYATGISALIVVALWGVFVWNEFRGVNPAAKTYSAATFLCYLLALFVIARAHNAAA